MGDAKPTSRAVSADLKRGHGVTKAAILRELASGELHVLKLARRLEINESAVRKHLNHLERLGRVQGFFRQEGLGRPKKYYRAVIQRFTQ